MCLSIICILELINSTNNAIFKYTQLETWADFYISVHVCCWNITTAALFPTTETSATVLSYNRNAYTEQVSLSLDFKSAISKDWLSVLQRSMLSLHAHKTKLLFSQVLQQEWRV